MGDKGGWGGNVTGESVDGGENRPVDVSGLILWVRGVDGDEDTLVAPLGWDVSALGFSRLSEGASGLGGPLLPESSWFSTFSWLQVVFQEVFLQGQQEGPDPSEDLLGDVDLCPLTEVDSG